MSAKDRVEWIDAARGTAMLAVVLGHVSQKSTWIGPAYFFLPLFFIISGYLQTGHRRDGFVTKKAVSLLLPYVCYLSFVVLLDATSGSPPPSISTLLYGGPALKGPYAAYWFVTCLFFAQVTYQYMSDYLGGVASYRTTAAMIALSVVSALPPLALSQLPLGLSVVPAAIVMIWVGALIRRYGLSGFAAAMFGFFGVVASLWLMLRTYPALPFDMKYANFGPPVIGLSAAIFFSIGITYCAMHMRGSVASALSFIGRASLPILFLHQMVQIAFAKVLGEGSIVGLFCAALALTSVVFLLLEKAGPAGSLLLGRGLVKSH